jgi:hypothetical protein
LRITTSSGLIAGGLKKRKDPPNIHNINQNNLVTEDVNNNENIKKRKI